MDPVNRDRQLYGLSGFPVSFTSSNTIEVVPMEKVHALLATEENASNRIQLVHGSIHILIR